jgi:hypothetical protein
VDRILKRARFAAPFAALAAAATFAVCGSSDSLSPSISAREQAMITNLASRGITFTPVGPDELGPPPKGSLPGVATPANGAVVYAGRLEETIVGDPDHRSYLFGDRIRPHGPSRAVTRLAYVSDTRDIRACSVGPSKQSHRVKS